MLNTSPRSPNHEKELRKDIKDCLANLKSVKFGFIKLGEHCDASQSKAFTSAWCNIKNIKEETGTKNYYLKSEQLFQNAIDSLEYFRTRKSPDRSSEIKAAMEKLKSFYGRKGKELCTNIT